MRSHPATLAALAAFAVLPLTGCAGAAADQPARRTTFVTPALVTPVPLADAWVTAPREAMAPAPSRTLAVRQDSVLIGEPAPPPAPTRPHSRGRATVSFHRADLENAMRLLADSGRFNLVVESGLSGQVTASLRDVDAYDALVMIARANGADVRFERGIVMVRKAPAKQ